MTRSTRAFSTRSWISPPSGQASPALAAHRACHTRIRSDELSLLWSLPRSSAACYTASDFSFRNGTALPSRLRSSRSCVSQRLGPHLDLDHASELFQGIKVLLLTGSWCARDTLLPGLLFFPRMIMNGTFWFCAFRILAVSSDHRPCQLRPHTARPKQLHYLFAVRANAALTGMATACTGASHGGNAPPKCSIRTPKSAPSEPSSAR